MKPGLFRRVIGLGFCLAAGFFFFGACLTASLAPQPETPGKWPALLIFLALGLVCLGPGAWLVAARGRRLWATGVVLAASALFNALMLFAVVCVSLDMPRLERMTGEPLPPLPLDYLTGGVCAVGMLLLGLLLMRRPGPGAPPNQP